MTTYRSALVLGGARSGKSRLALQWAQDSAASRILIATAQAFDDEMRARISLHQEERDETWRTVEAPLALAQAVGLHAAPGQVVLVDCLTLWLSNILLAEHDMKREADALADAVREAKGPVILVSNEVGHGIVPATPLGRIFRDEQGRLNQLIAQACEAVAFVAAGCPVLLKPCPPLNLQLG
jgi:adenosylcobinamide kinase / adenosylcobinamide-phosphate guanylyltransferase